MFDTCSNTHKDRIVQSSKMGRLNFSPIDDPKCSINHPQQNSQIQMIYLGTTGR